MVTENSIKEKILAILMSDSRKSFRAIAKELNISTTTVSKIVKEFEDAGIIQGYTALIDWRKMGYDSTMCLQVGVTPEADIDKVGKELKALPALKQVFYTPTVFYYEIDFNIICIQHHQNLFLFEAFVRLFFQILFPTLF